MPFPALFKQPKQKPPMEKTPAKKLLILVQELLNKELPHHQSQHHILFTANMKLENLQESMQYHRKQIKQEYNLGQYHQKIYSDIVKAISDLQGLVDCYMELQIDLEQMNHRLHFHHHSIDYLYTNYLEMTNNQVIETSQPLFWQAMKDDVLVITRNVF